MSHVEDKGKQQQPHGEEDPMHADDIAENLIRLLAQADYGHEIGDVTFTPTPKKSLLRRQQEKQASEEEAQRIANELVSRLSLQYAEDLGEIGDIVFMPSPTKPSQNSAEFDVPPAHNHVQRRSHRKSAGAKSPEPVESAL